MRAIRITLYSMLLFLLAGCGSSIPTDSPGPSSQIIDSGSFTATVTGDFEITMPPGTILYTYTPALPDLGLPEKDSLLMTVGGAASDLKQIIFDLPTGLSAGTYPVTSIVEAEDNAAVTAAFSVLVGSSEDSEPVAMEFNRDVYGTLTLSEVGETLNGSFEFSADAVRFEATGEEIRQTITAEGTFSDVPYFSE